MPTLNWIGKETSCAAKAVRSSFRRLMVVFTQIFSASSPNGVVLAVEYKGADRWSAHEDDRLISGLWGRLSEGRCRFVMITDKRWEGIEEILQ